MWTHVVSSCFHLDSYPFGGILLKAGRHSSLWKIYSPDCTWASPFWMFSNSFRLCLIKIGRCRLLTLTVLSTYLASILVHFCRLTIISPRVPYGKENVFIHPHTMNIFFEQHILCFASHHNFFEGGGSQQGNKGYEDNNRQVASITFQTGKMEHNFQWLKR